MNEKNIIFIISQPRSGSTFLQNLLSNNKYVNTCSEPWILLNFANQIKHKLVQGEYDNTLALEAFYNYRKNFPELKPKELLKTHILALYEPLKKDHKFIIDKTPRYWEIIHEIVDLFPKAKLIVLKRNPVDVVSSLIKTYKMESVDELNQFRRDLLYAPKRLHEFYLAQQDNPNVRFLTYEQLKSDTETVVSELYEWIGVPYSEKVLDVSNNPKILGHFGDPYQNDDVSYKASKGNAEKRKIGSSFERFLQGYVAYLGIDFLKEYGYSKIEVSPKKTNAFHYFTHLGSRHSPKPRNLKNYLKAVYLRSRSK